MTEDKLKKLIKIIEDPNYIIMWVDPYGVKEELNNKIKKENDEIIVFIKGSIRYIDLYNINIDEIKCYVKIEL